MLIGILSWEQAHNEGWKCLRSNFWSKIGWTHFYKKKGSMKYIEIWDLPWRAFAVVLAEPLAFFLLFISLIHFFINKIINNSNYSLLHIRMLHVLEKLPILKQYYKKVQIESGKDETIEREITPADWQCGNMAILNSMGNKYRHPGVD